MNADDFLNEESPQQEGPSTAPLPTAGDGLETPNSSACPSPTPSEDQPAILGFTGTTLLDIEEVEGAPRRQSNLFKEQMRQTIANITVRGKFDSATVIGRGSVNSRMPGCES